MNEPRPPLRPTWVVWLSYMTTNQKGAITEAAIVYAALRRGIDVYKPIGEGGRYDLIFDLGTRLVRVQCKTAVRRREVIIVPVYSSRRTRNGFVRRSYTPAEVDVIVAYSPEVDRCYVLPLDRLQRRTYVQLRLEPTRNNQARGVNWAAEFEFESLDWKDCLGP